MGVARKMFMVGEMKTTGICQRCGMPMFNEPLCVVSEYEPIYGKKNPFGKTTVCCKMCAHDLFMADKKRKGKRK